MMMITRNRMKDKWNEKLSIRERYGKNEKENKSENGKDDSDDISEIDKSEAMLSIYEALKDTTIYVDDAKDVEILDVKMEIGPLKDKSCLTAFRGSKSTLYPLKYTLVNTKEGLVEALSALSAYDTIAFDCEGHFLSRKGKLTVACFLGFESGKNMHTAVAYVIDVYAMHGIDVFSISFKSHSLKSMLESTTTLKLMFDVRTDSDALFHQFGVKLSNVMDVQLLHLAMKRLNPSKCLY